MRHMRQLGFTQEGSSTVVSFVDETGRPIVTSQPAGRPFWEEYKTVLIIAAAALFALAIIKALQGGRR